MEDDSHYCWLCTARLDQFIASWPATHFFSLFSMLKAPKKAYFHKHFEVFFFIADSYNCVKSCIQVSVQMHQY